jgi:hypothetical protein
MNTEQPQESFGSGASEAPAARTAELRSLHTQGPWTWVSPNYLCGGERGLVDILIAGDDRKPYGMHSALIEHHYDEPTAVANRALIAAAPELAEQLLEALEFIEDHADVSDGPDGSPRPNRAMQLCEPIRAALAKAGVKP